MIKSNDLLLRGLFFLVSIQLVACGTQNQPRTLLKSQVQDSLKPNAFEFVLEDEDSFSNSVFSEELEVKVNTLRQTAKSYLGTPYWYGGTTRRGIDCSGFMINVFSSVDIRLPRRSADQAMLGFRVTRKDIQPGDMLFFNTSRRGVSHAAMVERVENGKIYFIHASTSKGVIISSLDEPYWSARFVSARRILG